MERSGAVGQSLLSVYSDSATHACQLFAPRNQVLLSEILLFLHKTCSFSVPLQMQKKKKKELVLNPITMPGIQSDMVDK